MSVIAAATLAVSKAANIAAVAEALAELVPLEAPDVLWPPASFPVTRVPVTVSVKVSMPASVLVALSTADAEKLPPDVPLLVAVRIPVNLSVNVSVTPVNTAPSGIPFVPGTKPKKVCEAVKFFVRAGMVWLCFTVEAEATPEKEVKKAAAVRPSVGFLPTGSPRSRFWSNAEI